MHQIVSGRVPTLLPRSSFKKKKGLDPPTSTSLREKSEKKENEKLAPKCNMTGALGFLEKGLLKAHLKKREKGKNFFPGQIA